MGLQETGDYSRATECVQSLQPILAEAALDALNSTTDGSKKGALVPDICDELPRQIVRIFCHGVIGPQSQLAFSLHRQRRLLRFHLLALKTPHRSI